MTTPTGAINRRGSFRPGERVQILRLCSGERIQRGS